MSVLMIVSSGVLFITCSIHEQLLLLLHWLSMSAVFWLSYVLCTIWGDCHTVQAAPSSVQALRVYVELQHEDGLW